MHQYSLSRLMTETDVAEHFSVSVKTLRRWRAIGLIECMKAPGDGRVVRFHRRQLEECLQKMATVEKSGATPKREASASSDPVEDDVAAFHRAYEISQELEPTPPQSRGKKGK